MSRLSKKPISIPSGVAVSVEGENVLIKGSKGDQGVLILPWTLVEISEGGVTVKSTDLNRQARANIGTMWSLIKGAIEGAHNGYTKTLEIEGVGYRAQVEGNSLSLSLGYVNPVKFPIPSGISISTEKNAIIINGINKDLVGRTASEIRSLKKPEPYKGKGIRYRGEVIVRKVGKKAAGTTA